MTPSPPPPPRAGTRSPGRRGRWASAGRPRGSARAVAPRPPSRRVRDILAPEVAAGVLSETEVEATLDKKAGKAYRKAAPNHHARKGRKHLRHAILDLTHAIGASRGAESDDVSHARAEVARIRVMAEPQPTA
ncbi:hypothetical protein GCM10009668_21830 [Nocardioides dubius]|uniref:CHAD domain-containing protein n=1 Tax=Nocardioides dubius TaxID=317019 RepID=A0ABP4EFA8_9ACTN